MRPSPHAATILAAFAALTLCVQASSAQPLQGTIQQHSFIGPVTGQAVNFNIYLPPGYAQNLGRYPVIYHLHGIGGNQGGGQNTIVPAAFEQAMASRTIGPVIIIFANGYTDAWWANAFDGSKPAETDVISQLIPYVDTHFRTKSFAGARVIEGFSMGGFGATKFYTKFPNQFAACVEYDGAMVTWPVMLQFHASLAASIFNNSETYFNQFSPWYWSTQNAAILQDKPPVRMVIGALVGGNQNFRDHLQSLSIPFDYVTTGCAHDIGCLFTAQGQQSAAFIASHLDLGAPADLDGDGDVDVNDLLALITVWGPCPSPGGPGADCPADLNHDGSIAVTDLLMLITTWG